MEFEEYVRARLPDLVRFMTAVTADRALAEDIVQEVLVRLHGRWDRIQTLAAPDLYVRRCLLNEHVSWRRKWARVIPHATVPESDVSSPDPAAVHAERTGLQAELAELPARQRAVLVMRFYGGLTDAEIAQVLGCRSGTVRGYASRALATLRIGHPTIVEDPAGSEHAN